MATVLWLRQQYVRRDGRSWRDYTVATAGGDIRFTATAARVPGPITVWRAPSPAVEYARARPRRSFPLTGRYDVFSPTGERLGIATRSGRIFDASGTRLGRFRDARSLKQHLGEGVVTAILDGMTGGESGTADMGGPRGYVLELEAAAPGRLVRAPLPFAPASVEPPRAPGRLATVMQRVLPGRAVARVLGRGRTHGWMLEVPDGSRITEPLLLVGAVLAIEIALW